MKRKPEHLSLVNMEDFTKNLKDEMRKIKKEAGVKSAKTWDGIEVKDMDAEGAFNRGFFRAYETIVKHLQGE